MNLHLLSIMTCNMAFFFTDHELLQRIAICCFLLLVCLIVAVSLCYGISKMKESNMTACYVLVGIKILLFAYLFVIQRKLLTKKPMPSTNDMELVTMRYRSSGFYSPTSGFSPRPGSILKKSVSCPAPVKTFDCDQPAPKLLSFVHKNITSSQPGTSGLSQGAKQKVGFKEETNVPRQTGQTNRVITPSTTSKSSDEEQKDFSKMPHPFGDQSSAWGDIPNSDEQISPEPEVLEHSKPKKLKKIVPKRKRVAADSLTIECESAKTTKQEPKTSQSKDDNKRTEVVSSTTSSTADLPTVEPESAKTGQHQPEPQGGNLNFYVQFRKKWQNFHLW